MPRVALHTLGCKLNYAETSSIGRQFADRGYEIVEFGQPADVCVVNTCTVTERANRECRQIIRRALRSSQNPVVVVTGCYAQLEPERIASIQGVNLVLGAREKFDLLRYLESVERGAAPRIIVSDVGTADDFGPAASTDVADRTRAFLKVQDGCDYTCSFCTIPLARGASRSQSVDASVLQARSLVASGYKEIVLTGVNVGDFGRKTGTSFLSLLEALSGVEGLERLRISSIEPNLLTSEILEFVGANPLMCKHFHIPLQSGDDMVLRMMRRRYAAHQYADLVGEIRSVLPDAGIGVDVIVGFPGESDASFQTTYDFLRDLPVSYFHVFTYSERPGTPAALLPEPVPPAVRHARNRMLRILSQKKRHAFHQSMVGKTVPVLTEGVVEHGLRYGLTSNYARVGLPADGVAENVIVPVAIVSADHDVCSGNLASTEALR